MAPPPNDACANAITVTLPFSTTVNTTEATDDPSYPDTNCGSGDSFNGIWYRWVAPADYPYATMRCRLRDDGVGTWSVITMFSGDDCGSLVDTGECNAGTSSGFTANFPITPGTTYFFLLTTFASGGLAAIDLELGASGDFCTALSLCDIEPSPTPTPVSPCQETVCAVERGGPRIGV